MIFITLPPLGEPKSSSRKEAKKRRGRQDSPGKKWWKWKPWRRRHYGE